MSEGLRFDFPNFADGSFNSTGDVSGSVAPSRNDETKGYTCGCPESNDCPRTAEGYTCESCTPCQLTVHPCD